MTPEEWEDLWEAEYRRLRKQFPAAELRVLQKAAIRFVEGKHGPKPDGLPLVVKAGVAVLRKEPHMKKVLKALEGWKLVIGVAVLFAVKVWDGMNNGHAGDIVGNVLSILGWMPGAESGFTVEGITVAAASGMALWGFVAKLWRAHTQLKAGSSVAGLLSTEGYVKAYTAEKK